MKKLFLILVMVFGVSGSFAAQHSTQDIVWVEDFTSVSEQYEGRLKQANTGLNYSCGPTSLMFVMNYHQLKNQGFPAWYANDLLSAVFYVRSVYDNMGISFNTITSTDNLSTYVKSSNEPLYSSSKADGNDDINYNLNLMKGWLADDYPVILAMEPNYSGNPVQGSAHIVIVYAYDGLNNYLYFYDPYYGNVGSVKFDDLASAFQGNLPYLRVFQQ